MSTIKVDNVLNSTGDQDSGLDLSTNDQIILKTADTTALTVNASQQVALAGNATIAGTLGVTGNTTLQNLTVSGTATGVGGVTSAQSFRLSQNVAGSGSLQMFDPFEEADTQYTRVGSQNWTVSAGAFSVAQTGTYLCNYHAQVEVTGSGDAFDLNIQISTNSGGAYTLRSRCWAYGGSNYENASNTFIFTVSTTSSFRLRMVAGMANAISSSTNILGGSDENQTGITFVKLA